MATGHDESATAQAAHAPEVTHGVTLAPSGPLRDEVALVTGASSGIGAACALELARRGAPVVLAARRTDELEALAGTIRQLGPEVEVVPTDVSDQGQLARLVARAVERFGRVDVLVNNAGIGYGDPFVKTPPEEIVRMMQTNLMATILLTRHLLPAMLGRGHGTIVNIGSVAGRVAADPMYSATKYGVRGFTLSLRRQVRGRGVGVSLVEPGFIRTELTAGMRGKLPGPEVVARVVADLVLHPKREVIVPGYYRVGAWVEQVLPAAVDRAIRPRE